MDTSVDTQGFADILKQFPTQVEYAATLGKDITFDKTFENITIVGMGGSGIAGELIKTLDVPIPIFSIKEYAVPEYIQKKSLVFVISYSGETEETIDAYRKLVRRNASIVCISSGGKLEQLAPMYKNHHIKVPNGLQPRQAIGYMTLPIVNVLAQCGLFTFTKEDAISLVQTLKKDVYQENAKKFLEKIRDKIPLIYATSKLYPIAYRWKTCFNENANSMSFCSLIPELHHNELNAYEYTHGQFFTIIMKDNDDDRRLKDQMSKLKDVIKKSNNEAIELVIKGENKIAKLFSAIYLGDWITYYYAIDKGVDPTPIKLIEEFKKK